MAFDFYFAGTQCVESEYLLRDLNANVLKSYVNDKREIERFIQYKKEGWYGKLMIDNGAFTIHRRGGQLDIDKYIDWLNDRIDYIDYAIALDDIPGRWGEVKTWEQVMNSPINTWNNYLYMIDRVIKPEKLLPVFHMGESFEHLENMVNDDRLLSNYICISGNKELTNKQREEWYDKCFHIIRNSKRPNLRVHCLGSATIQNAEKFPFISMDATSWIMTAANGSILSDVGVIYVGDGGRSLNGESKYNLNLLLSRYGFSLEDVGSNYKARVLTNIYYLFEASHNTEFIHTSVNKRRLF